MTFLFGNDVVVDGNQNSKLNPGHFRRFTAVADATATEIVINLQSTNDSVKVAIYLDSDYSKLGEGSVIANGSTGDQVLAIDTPFAVTAGTNYVIQILSQDYTLFGENQAAGNLYWGKSTSVWDANTDPLVGAGSSANLGHLRVFVQGTTTPSTSVTQADVTPEDGATQSFTSTGLTGAYTAASVGGYSILAGLSNTDPETASTYTLDVYATDTQTALPRLLDDVTLSVTATGGTATQTLNIQPQTGTGAVKLTSVTASSFVTLLANAGITLAIGDIINWSTANNAVITDAAVYTSDLTAVGQFTRLIVQQGGDATTPATTTSFKYYPFGTGSASTGTFNDRLMSALSAYTGTLNDRLFKYLRAQGYTGALPDMIFKAGGWNALMTTLGVL